MRVTVLTTGTNNTKPIYEPLRRLGNDLTVIVYDAMDEHSQLPKAVGASRPDWVLLIGAIEAHHGKPVPKVDVLGKIGAEHLLVHLCCDGGEPAWWEQLQSYYDRGNFALQVNIDGVRVGPIGDRGLVMLCPIDAAQFPDPPRPWAKRLIPLGFGGGIPPSRSASILEMQRLGLLAYRPRDAEGYDGYRDFLCSCRCTLNDAMTGGGTRRQHVKARVIEAALAGSLLFEPEGSPTGDWFEPGVDYLTYRNAADVARQLAWVQSHGAEAEAMALRLRGKVVVEHGPSVFWGRVLEYLGLGDPVAPVRQVPYQNWHLNEGGPAAESAQKNGSFVPLFLMTGNKINFVSYGPHVYACPQSVGSIDLANDLHRSKRGIQRFDTLKEAKIALRCP
jgi:hypothetical protein